MQRIRFIPTIRLVRARHALRLLALLPLLTGCETTELSASPAEVLIATTDRGEYQLVNGSTTVTVHLRNLGNHVVEVVGCPDPPAMLLEQQTAGEWQPLQSQNVICQAIHLQRTVRVDPGTEYTGQIRVNAPGEFRARVFIGPTQPTGLSATVTTRGFVVR